LIQNRATSILSLARDAVEGVASSRSRPQRAPFAARLSCHTLRLSVKFNPAADWFRKIVRVHLDGRTVQSLDELGFM
jgi:hypothetical protein